MSEILSQDEMDSLLNALSPAAGGETGEDAGDTPSGEADAPAPVATALKPGQKIKPYDFRRPDRFSNEQIRTLQIIHENFGRIFAASLSTHLRTIVEIKVTSASQVTFEEFTKSVPNPTNLNIFSVSPLQGTAILEMNPVLVFTLIDRILGGPGGTLTKQRALTDIENNIMEKIIKRALDNLKEAWQHAAALNFKLEAMESNPLFVQIVAPQETVALITFEVKIKTVTSTMSICTPYVVLESIISKLRAHQWFSAIKKAESDIAVADLKKGIERTMVPIIAQLGTAQITVKELLDMKKSQVIKLERSISDDLEVFVGNKLTFYGRPGVVRKRKGIQIVNIIKEEETNG